MARLVEQRFHIRHVEGLLESRSSVRVQEVARRIGERAPRDENEPIHELGLTFGHCLVHLHATKYRHHEITQDQIEVGVTGEVFDCFLPRIEHNHIALTFERESQGLTQEWFIIDN